MNSTKVFAMILIALGVIALAYQGIQFTTREKVIDLGPVEVTRDKTSSIPLPPIIGAIALMGGLGLLFVGAKKA